MEDKKPTFHSGSRKPFPEEEPVMAVVRRVKDDVAKRHGGSLVQGAALFKSFADASAAATVTPRAVDIVNEAVNVIKGVAGVAVASGFTARIVSGATDDGEAPKRSGIANARGEVAASLRRLGVLR